MAIELHCSCGKRLSVADEQAGRKVRCPTCQELLRVPGQAEEDGYDLEESRKCPKCRREWPGDAVLCVACGYNFETGKKVERVYQILTRTVDIGVRWLGTYTRLLIFRDRKGRTTLTIAKRFLFIPVGRRVIELKDYDSILTDVSLGYHDEDGGAPDIFYLDLEGPRKKPVRILKTSNEWKMREVIDTLQEMAQFQIKRK